MWWKIIWIAAMDEDRIIGKEWWMPWHESEDLQWFKEHVQNQICLMWRKTYEWFKEHLHTDWYRYAKKNLVLSKSMPDTPGVENIRSIEELKQKYGNEIIWVLWWASVFEALMPYLDEIYLTLIPWKHEWDTKMPEIPPYEFYCESLGETKSWLKFEKYTKITEPEALRIMSQYKHPSNQ